MYLGYPFAVPEISTHREVFTGRTDQFSEEWDGNDFPLIGGGGLGEDFGLIFHKMTFLTLIIIG